MAAVAAVIDPYAGRLSGSSARASTPEYQRRSIRLEADHWSASFISNSSTFSSTYADNLGFPDQHPAFIAVARVTPRGKLGIGVILRD
jgi:hypothetical protein